MTNIHPVPITLSSHYNLIGLHPVPMTTSLINTQFPLHPVPMTPTPIHTQFPLHLDRHKWYSYYMKLNTYPSPIQSYLIQTHIPYILISRDTVPVISNCYRCCSYYILTDIHPLPILSSMVPIPSFLVRPVPIKFCLIHTHFPRHPDWCCSHGT